MFHIEEFLSVVQKRYKPETVEKYRSLLEDFAGACLANDITSAGAVGATDVIRFLSPSIHRKPVSHQTRARAARLAWYFRYLEENGRIFASPMREIRLPKAHGSHFPAVPAHELNSLIDGVDSSHPFMIRGRAMLELAYSAALRPGEIRRLHIGDVDDEAGLLYIRNTKGGKSRVVPVGETALVWTERYLTEARPRYAGESSADHIFISHKTGAPLTVYGVRYALQETARRLGFTPFKPYSLRKSSATHLLESGMSIAYISKLLGHEDLRTTTIYLEIEHSRMSKIVTGAHPRNHMKSADRKGGRQ